MQGQISTRKGPIKMSKDFSEIINDMKSLTFGQIFKLLPKIQWKVWVSGIFTVMSVLGITFAAGRYSQQKKTAVLLNSPFSMRIEIDGARHDFFQLTIMKDPTLISPGGESVALSLREFKSPFDIVQVGQILAQIEENKFGNILEFIVIKDTIGKAYARTDADPVFNWNGHERDTKFKEKFINDNTVHRYYSDGCILEYKVDSNKRRSIPTSFKWIKKTH